MTEREKHLTALQRRGANYYRLMRFLNLFGEEVRPPMHPTFPYWEVVVRLHEGDRSKFAETATGKAKDLWDAIQAASDDRLELLQNRVELDNAIKEVEEARKFLERGNT